MIKDLINKYNSLKAELTSVIGQQLSNNIAQLLNHPFITCISWKGYSLYFNDGDDCPFEVWAYPSDIIVNNKYSQYGEDWPDSLSAEDIKEIEKIVENVSALVLSVPNEIMEDIFGNHVKVTVFKNGEIKIDNYSNHD